MRSFVPKEPTHTIRVSRTVYVNICNAAKAQNVVLEKWLPNALANQILEEQRARDRADYREACEVETVRPTFDEWRERRGLPKL